MTTDSQIPAAIRKLYSEQRWAELMFYFRALWNEKNWLYLKKNKNAVSRIKQEFKKLTGNDPYPRGNTNTKFWDEQIAKYCAEVGVKELIVDMREAVGKYRVKSIIYFLWSGGKACRWEMLFMSRLEHRWKEQKEAEREEWKEIADKLGFQNAFKAETEPDWVIKARKRYQQLGKLLKMTPGNYELQQEALRISNNFKQHGYKLKE